MKTVIVNERDSTRVPFLRGILTQTLLDAGMTFDAAFELATEIRNELADTAQIAAADLRKLVTRKIEATGDEAVLEHYRAPVTGRSRILVLDRDGATTFFSRGRHVRLLQASGMRTSVAEEITGKIYEQLLASATESISRVGLGYLTYRCILQETGSKAARRYLVWTQFESGDKPLLLLLGGSVGSGKSTIATQIAHRLEIVRTQSTDMLREVMRMMIPERLLPMLHSSSFEAWRSLPIQDKKDRDTDALVAEGFRLQAELLSGPCEAVLQRAERESVSMILEGVHALPDLLERTAEDSDAIVVHTTLAILQSGELKARLRGRSTQEPKRRAKRYLKNFDSIWSLQSFLLSEADRYNTPIIVNDDIEKAIQQVVVTTNDELAKHYQGDAAETFGDVGREHERKKKTQTWQQLVPSLINK